MGRIAGPHRDASRQRWTILTFRLRMTSRAWAALVAATINEACYAGMTELLNL